MVRRRLASFPDAFPPLDRRVAERLHSCAGYPAATALDFWSEDPSIHANGHLLPASKFCVLAFAFCWGLARVRSDCQMYVHRRLSAFAIAARRRRPERGTREPAAGAGKEGRVSYSKPARRQSDACVARHCLDDSARRFSNDTRKRRKGFAKPRQRGNSIRFREPGACSKITKSPG